MSRDSFLTDRQLEILKMRNSNLSQAEIARRLGTTRANISSTERTAKENIKKAENTLKIAGMLNASLVVRIAKDTDLNEAPKRIYEEAGKNEIWVNLDTPSLVGLITRECKDKIKGRRITADIEIAITKEGDILAR